MTRGRTRIPPTLALAVLMSCGGSSSSPRDGGAVDATQPACVPGASVACTGVGGCAGGQVCAADGSSFGPCQCGGATDGGGGSSSGSGSGSGSGGGTDGGSDSGACTAANCATGCCASDGNCVTKVTNQACGTGGQSCVDCSVEGMGCAPDHTCSTCPVDCTGCCDTSNSCWTTFDNKHCPVYDNANVPGQPCSDCTLANDAGYCAQSLSSWGCYNQ